MVVKVVTGDCTEKTNGCWLLKRSYHILLSVSIGIDMGFECYNDLLKWMGVVSLGGLWKYFHNLLGMYL